MSICRLSCLSMAIYLLLLIDVGSTKAQKMSNPSKSDQQMITQSAYIEGLAAFENEQYQKSLRLLQSAYQEDPENAAFSYALADVYKSMDKLSQAQQYAEKSVVLNSNNKWYRLKLAEICRLREKTECTINQMSTALKNHPKNTLLLKKLATYYKEDGRLLKANATYSKLLFLQGEKLELRLQRLRNFDEFNLKDSVLTELQKIREEYPQNKSTRQLLSRWYLQMGRSNKAKQLLQETDRAAVSSNNRLELVNIYLKESRWNRAGTLLNQFVADSMVNLNKKTAVGERLLDRIKKGNRDSELHTLASSYFQRLMQIAPQSAKVQELTSDFFLKANKEEKALKALEQTTKLNPANDSAWKKRLKLLLEEGDIDQVIHVGKQASEAIPQDPKILYYLGKAEHSKEKFESAIKTLKKASLLPARRSIKGKILSLLADSYFTTKQWNNAFQKYEEAMQINPKSAELLNRYAYHLAERKRNLKKAKQMARNALELDPDNASYRATVGWILYQQQKYKEAEELIRSAIESGNPTAGMMEHLGDTMLKRSKSGQAVCWWEKALQKDSTRTYLNEKICTARDSQ